MKISKRRIFVLFIFVTFILIETISFAAYQTAVIEDKDKKKTLDIMLNEEVILSEEEAKTLELINEYRDKNGLTKLKPISKLQEIATLKAKDIVENEYFSHISPDLGTPFEMLKANGVEYSTAGENLAGNTTPERTVEAWINSELHRENILEEDFEYTGIAVIESPIYGKVYVQLFMNV